MVKIVANHNIFGNQMVARKDILVRWYSLSRPYLIFTLLILDLLWLMYRVSQKNAPKIVWIISLATNMLDSCDISHLKNGICSSVWSTKTFLYDIREPRYKRNNMEYHISKFLNIEQSSVMKTDTQYCFPYISVLPWCRTGFELENAYGCYL